MPETQVHNIHDVCDYIVVKLDEGGEHLSHLKLQKLLYYVQAWWLALNDDQPFFNGKFQAWVHGPVSRSIYDRFKDAKSLYSSVTIDDVRKDFDIDVLDREAKLHIDEVLDVYAPFSGSELEDMTHQEDPWLQARKGYASSERCEVALDESLMGKYYRQRLDS